MPNPAPTSSTSGRSIEMSGTPMSLPPTSLPVRAAYAAAATPPANAMCGPKTGPKATKVRKLVPAPAIAIASPAITHESGEDEGVQGADRGCEESTAGSEQKCQYIERHERTFRALTSL